MLEHPSEPPAERLARIHRVLFPSSLEEAAAFVQLAADAEKKALSFQDSRRNYVLAAIGETCIRRGKLETAQRCLEEVDRASTTYIVDLNLADIYRKRAQWEKAADAYKAVWQKDHDQLSALYLAGEALKRAGRDDEANKMKQQASLMALESAARWNMTRGLTLEGMSDDIVEQCTLIMRTAPMSHIEWAEAVYRLSNLNVDESPEQAATLIQDTVLDDLLLTYYFRNDQGYLTQPLLIHKRHARAAIAAKDFERAGREIQLALAADPGNSRLAEDLVPLLEKAGGSKQADDLFQSLFDHYSALTKQYPESPLLHNNIAWLSARCGRQLDSALTHAKKAVELAPNNAGHIDTLAETHFRLGDREAAVRHSKRATELRPLDENLKNQLKRFQNDPLPKILKNKPEE